MVKFVGLIIGYLLGRIPGAIIGFLIGLFIDSLSTVQVNRGPGGGPAGGRGFDPFFVLGPTDFTRSLLMLSAAVMKADGKVMRSELEYARAFFQRQFGEAHTQQLLIALRDILKQEIPLRYVCDQVSQHMRYEVRLQLVHYLFGLAASDNSVSSPELNVIRSIAAMLGVSSADVESLKAMFYADPESDYKILEILPEATDDEVKKAYRKMALKYHPDKLTQMGEEFQKAGQEKFQMVQQAYERIKKARGMV